MSKKILWLSHFLPYPPKGGNLQRSYNLLKEASKAHDITLLSFNQRAILKTEGEIEEAKEQLSKFCTIAGIYPIESDVNKWKKMALALQSLVPGKTYTTEWLRSPPFKCHVQELINSNDFDIIHVDTISLMRHIPSTGNCTISLTHHNIESEMLFRRSKNEKNIIKKYLYFYEAAKLKKIESKACPQVSLNITCSKLDTIRLLAIAPTANCIDIPNGVDITYFKPLSSNKIENSLIFAGGLSWYPNLAAMKFFLDLVWPKLVTKIPNIKMTVIGRSPPDWMIALQHTYPNLKVTGFVDDVRPYLDAATLYICPINDGGGTKLKILDALAMGKAIICHPIACEGIDVTDGVNVLFAEDPEQYISQICEALKSPEKVRTIEAAAADLVSEKYNFLNLGQQLSKAYENL